MSTRPLVVVHINHFTKRIIGGYILQNGRKIGHTMTHGEVLAHLAANPEIRVDFLHV